MAGQRDEGHDAASQPGGRHPPAQALAQRADPRGAGVHVVQHDGLASQRARRGAGYLGLAPGDRHGGEAVAHVGAREAHGAPRAAERRPTRQRAVGVAHAHHERRGVGAVVAGVGAVPLGRRERVPRGLGQGAPLVDQPRLVGGVGEDLDVTAHEPEANGRSGSPIGADPRLNLRASARLQER